MTAADTPVPDAITLLPDVVYNTDVTRPLTLHLLRPQAPSAQLLPVVVWIFGGAWMGGNKNQGLPMLLPFAQRGYLCASIEYRLSGEAIFPAQIHDCKCAIRFLRSQSAVFGLDPNRIGVWGVSSGGHLAALLGTTADVPELEGEGGWPEFSSRVQAVCDCFGPTDFLQMDRAGSALQHDAPDSPESRLIGGPIQEHPDRVARANPITYITRARALPPFLIVHGDQAPLVPFNQSELLVEALRRAGADVRFHRVVGGGHGDSAFETDEVRGLVEEFFAMSLAHGMTATRYEDSVGGGRKG